MASVGFAYGSFGDILETLKLIPKIDGLIRNGGAPSSSWEATKKDLQALCNELTHLTTIHPPGANQFIDERLKDERERCFSTASEFHSKLAASRSLLQKAMWITSEEAELAAFQRQLAGRRAALSGIVDQINMISLKQVQAMSEEVHFRTDRIADGVGGVSQKLTDQEQTLSGGFNAVRSRVEDLDERLKDGVAGVNQQLIGQKRKFKLLEESSLEEKLEKWLEFPPGMAKKQHDSQKIHHEGTGEWFLGGPEFAKWKDSDDSAYLWINGPSGTGKTVLSSTVIRTLFESRTQKAAVGYFYFDFRDEKQQQVEIMLRSIVLQLSAQASDPYAALNAQYNFYDGQSLPTYRNLVDVLETLVSDAGRTYLVLDALDESKDTTLLIRLISELQCWTNSRLHLLLTSQPRDIFTAAFAAVPQVALEFEVTKGDIGVFVSSELQSNPDLEHLADRAEEVASKVVLKSSGMFRLAACLLDELCRQKLDPDVDAIVADLPNDLFGIYGRFLEPIHPKDFIHVARVLHWLVRSRTPMTMDEMKDVLAMECSDPERHIFNPSRRGTLAEGVCKMLQGLITVGPSQASFSHSSVALVVFSHSSVADYVGSGEFRLKHKQSFGHGASDTFIAQTCVGYLLHFANDKDRGPEFPSPSQYPLFTYASTFWTHHLLCCDNRALLLPTTIHLLRYLGIWDPPHVPALMRCAQIGYIEGVRFLLERGADVNEMGGGYYACALTAACRMGHRDIVVILLHHGAHVNGLGDSSALQAACDEGHTDIVRLLLGYEDNLEDQAFGGALQAALRKGHADVVQLLIEHGASHNISDIDRVLAECGPGVTAPMQSMQPLPPDLEEGNEWGRDRWKKVRKKKSKISEP